MIRCKRKSKIKNQYDFNIQLIDEINKIKLQNQHLRERIRALENRVTDLEISVAMRKI